MLKKGTMATTRRPKETSRESDRPNIVYFHVDNLGYGEVGCYGGGILRGADTKRIDQFAREGFQLLNFAPEAQCTPSRTASTRSGHCQPPLIRGDSASSIAWGGSAPGRS